MLTREEYQNVIANCVIRFIQYHPDCGFGLDTFAFSVVEPEKFIDTVMSSKENADITMTREECARHHGDNDGILIRGKTKSTIIVKYLPEKPLVMLFIIIYHELAHAYALERELASGYDFLMNADNTESDKVSQTGKSDIIAGYLLWKEFIADYLAYDALHHDVVRFSAKGKDGINAMNDLIPHMCGDVLTPTASAFSPLANACGIIMNFADFHQALYGGKLETPIKRTTKIGRALYDMFMNLLHLLSGKMESENPYAVTDSFLNDLGYVVIEVQLLYEDYSDAVGWE